MSNDNSNESRESNEDISDRWKSDPGLKVPLDGGPPPSFPPTKEFRCLKCSKEFKNEYELKVHDRKVHPT